MVIQVQYGDTNEFIEFPDGTTDDVIQGVMSSYQPIGGTPSKPEVPFAGSELPVQDQPPAPSIWEQIQEVGMKDIPFEETGSMLGTGAGAFIGGGPTLGAGTVPGGIVGGTMGGALGRKLDQMTGRIPPESNVASLGQSVKNEAIGAGLAVPLKFVGNMVGKPVMSTLSRMAQDTPLQGAVNFVWKNPNQTLKEKLISTKSIDPEAARVVGIDEATQRLIGRDPFTPFEKTGGKAGAGMQAKINQRVQKMIDADLMDSAVLESRAKVSQKLSNVLRGGVKDGSGITREAKSIVGENLKNQFDKALSTTKEFIKPLSREYNSIAGKAKFNIQGLGDEVNSLKQLASENIKNPEKEKILFDAIDEWINKSSLAVPNYVSGGTKSILTDKGERTFLDLQTLDNSIENAFTKFNPNLDIQKDKAMAFYKSDIKKGIFDKYLERAAKGKGADSIEATALPLHQKLSDWMGFQDDLINNRLARKIGMSGSKQAHKDVADEEVLKHVFKDTGTWESAERALKIANPDLIPLLKDRFKTDIAADAFDPRLGEVTFDRIMKARKSYGDDVIAKVAGEQYANDFMDSAVIAKALQGSEVLSKLSAGVPISITDQGAGLLRPLQQDVTMYKFSLAMGKNMFQGKVSDQQLYKAMTGKRGTELLKSMQRTNLDTPQAFLAYKELGKYLGIPESEDDESRFTTLKNSFMNGLANVLAEQQQTTQGE